MAAFNGPKFVTPDSHIYYPGYVRWLEQEVSRLQKRLTSQSQQMSDQQQQIARNFRRDYDYLPYEEDDNNYDR